MDYGFRCTLSEFTKTSASEKLGELISATTTNGFASQYTKQTEAWQSQLDLLGRLTGCLLSVIPSSADWWFLLEYEIPRRGKRPDVILLAEDLIFVIEFKIGARNYSSEDEWQVISYALDLRDFHLLSEDRTILPVLVATEASHTDPPLLPELLATANSVVQLQRTRGNGGSDLAKCIERSYQQFHAGIQRPINAEKWASAAYRPCPGIIEAAERLYAGHQVDDISHAFAHNLSTTTNAIREAIDSSQANGTRTICFVTGIPGAGKTLAGLNSVHDPRSRSHGRPAAVFLSGNGPLVKIVREALVRDCMRSKMNAREARRTVSTFVANVHGFLTTYGIKSPNAVPYENVIVFDEAQRAWDAAAVEKKHGIAKSEPEMVLEIMEKAPEWCTVVALIGGGQEIHRGEAGLEAWGAALSARQRPWRVIVSPEAVTGGGAVAGHRLFDTTPRANLTIETSPSLHLNVSVRSPRARWIGDWVNRLIAQEELIENEADSFSEEFPVVVTRDLDAARRWLRARADGSQRSGLLASSGALRLRAHGIEVSTGFRKGYSYVEWFLKGKEDSRSSSMLEVAATEFECQGLELDWTGICWGGDFLICPDSGKWRFQKFVGSKWQQVKQATEKRYIANKYRVLLTRARRGMVVWVPRGDCQDPTRDPRKFDATATFLESRGLRMI